MLWPILRNLFDTDGSGHIVTPRKQPYDCAVKAITTACNVDAVANETGVNDNINEATQVNS
jgi:hypothetical protein